MKSPRDLADLLFASDLRPPVSPGAELEIDGDYERTRFDGDTFVESVATGARFIESAFVGVAFDGGRLRKARLSDVWFEQTRLVALDIAEASLTDVWFTGCVFAGVQSFSTLLRRVTFRGCKLDSVNFRDCTLTDVSFEDCMLRDADFGGARLTRVSFGGATLTGADFTRVTCKSVDLRGARLDSSSEVPGIKAGYDSLRGARIDSLQLMTLAPLLAHHLGITVTDA
jgi:uncharacterized protein YjbI with pentapeptide repeats